MSYYETLRSSTETNSQSDAISVSVPAHDYTTELLTHLNQVLYQSLDHFQKQDKPDQMVETVNEWLMHLNQPLIDLPLHRELTTSTTHALPTQYKNSLRAWELIAPGQLEQEQLLHHISQELWTASAADWMVSFTRHSGIQTLVPALKEAEAQSKSIRILTSFYMNITEAKAIRQLMEFRNIEVKIYEPIKKNHAFHPKAYLFSRPDQLDSAIVGSSNLSKSALTHGMEWNIRIPSTPVTTLVTQAKNLFEQLWNSPEATICTEELLLQYEQYQQETPPIKSFSIRDTIAEPAVDYNVIEPNLMQIPALEELDRLRERKETKAMVIAATGTGKTYLAAFDVRQTQAKKVLFVAHRGKLLSQAEHTFKQVFSNENYTFGRYSGSQQIQDAQFTFATVQTLSKEVHLNQFLRDAFDYIIIDEFHHASSASYQNILDYFTPQFLLGVTATPERMDGQNIFQLVDYNIAYEVRLYDALAQDLLSPFHYFGIQDDESVDYSLIPQQNGFYVEQDLVVALERSTRTDYIVEMIRKFGFSGNQAVGLGFCVNINHAEFMEKEFKRHQIEAMAVTSKQSEEAREEAIRRLEDDQDPLQYIFTVDLFNEGVDIPKVNLMLFLRPTESPTIFIQQLGRGLRKHSSKEFVTILDFIGNSQKAFVAPLVLSGQQSFHSIDRYKIATAVKQHFPILPEGSLAILDSITERFIIEQMKKIEFSASKQLRESYQRLTRMIGNPPSLNDLVTHKDAPAIESIVQQWRSTLRLKQLEKHATDEELRLLQDDTTRKIVEQLEGLFPIREPFSLLILKQLLRHSSASVQDIEQEVFKEFALSTKHSFSKRPIIHHLFKRWSTALKNDRIQLLDAVSEEHYRFSNTVVQALQQSTELRSYMMHFIQAGLLAFHQLPDRINWLIEDQAFLLHQTYNRSVIQRLLCSPSQEGSWREGVAQAGNDYILFVNLHKDEAIDEQLKYNDYFLDQYRFHWQSQSNATATGKAGTLYQNHESEGIRIHLFMRKADKEQGKTLPFTYFGQLKHLQSTGSKPISVTWSLHSPLSIELFKEWQTLS